MPDAPAPPPTPASVSISLNGTEVAAHPGELVIDAAERHGVYIPRFCYHHRMRPVGMCRMCLVEIDAGRGPALQPSCMIPVTEAMKVDTESERTVKAQSGVLEFLLINHPLDCPVCDKGGECPLQDQTMAYGPGESRFVEEKRHFEKPIPISELVLLDRERCILCDRCTRFAAEVAGDPLIHFQGRGATTEVNTFPDEPFSSYFSGNTVQICPVGALTATNYRFKARPWDLSEVGSTCTTCSVGCAVALQSTHNRVVRQIGIDNDSVSWGWLCDRGRFDVEAIESPDRLGAPLLGGVPARWSDAMGRAAELLGQVSAPSAVGVIGGARLTNESAYAWAKLVKGVLGTDNVDCQLGDGLPVELVLGLPRVTVADACRKGATIVLLGPDPKETLGVLYLRLRHAVVEDGVTLIEVGHAPSGLSGHARHLFLGLPGGDLVAQARLAAEALRPDAPVTVVLGRTSLSEDPAVIAEAAHILVERGATFLPALVRGNVMGALELGLAPGVLPGRVGLEAGRAHFAEVWDTVPSARGLDTAAMLGAAAAGTLELLVLLGADPVADFPDRDLATAALERATVIAVDTFLTESSAHAEVVLAAAGFGEVSGTTTNLEGRILPVRQNVTPPGTARPDWMLAVELGERLGADLGFGTAEECWSEIATVSSAHADLRLSEVMVTVDGVIPGGTQGGSGDGGDRAEGNDGRPAMLGRPELRAASASPLDPVKVRLVVLDRMYDDATLTQHSPSLAGLALDGSALDGSAIAGVARLHPLDFDKLDIADGDEVTLVGERATLVLRAKRDPAVVRGGVTVFAKVPGAPVNHLLSADHPVTDVLLEVRR